VEAAARAYIQSIRETQPQGRYHLLGHSFGGLVVFEMARQLRAAGSEVAPVVLLDTAPPLSSLNEKCHYSRLSLLRRLILAIEEKQDCELNLPDSLLRPLNNQEQLVVLHDALVSRHIVPRHSSVSLLSDMFRVFCAQLNEAYVPASTLEIDVLLIKPADALPQPDSLELARAAWAPHASRLTVVQCSGNHMTMLDPPRIMGVATHVAKIWNL
jgi:thioesterase domain-containing protein